MPELVKCFMLFNWHLFTRELEALLGKTNQSHITIELAQLVAPGLDLEPRRRPSNVKEWTQKIGVLLRGF